MDHPVLEEPVVVGALLAVAKDQMEVLAQQAAVVLVVDKTQGMLPGLEALAAIMVMLARRARMVEKTEVGLGRVPLETVILLGGQPAPETEL
jgi:hypothetical protein